MTTHGIIDVADTGPGHNLRERKFLVMREYGETTIEEITFLQRAIITQDALTEHEGGATAYIVDTPKVSNKAAYHLTPEAYELVCRLRDIGVYMAPPDYVSPFTDGQTQEEAQPKEDFPGMQYAPPEWGDS